MAEQPQPYFGLNISTRMTAIRQRRSNRLVAVSPIQPSAEPEQGLAALGVVSATVAPSAFHRPHLQAFQQRFPQATGCGPPFLRKKCPHTDSAFHFDASAPWPSRCLTRIRGGYAHLEPTILKRLATSDRGSLARAMQVVLEWDFDRVIVAHGAVVETGGKQALARAYSSFLGSHLP
ncbi:hypothetical protein [Synechococcus sp. BA-132 BA5]|uniref:hypothetical protein n=1 Tax=Synechococcus sp. BA-132 BA5 TaxID=3110252 RepID=UPI002B20F9EE|nr:hypothetical protein [Synechococcus sp. BA-132 BA5]MEA5413816.1 hypothetical protein [Synechococcus sp. BA-132 BA5]